MQKWYTELTGEEIITEVNTMARGIQTLIEKGLTELAWRMEHELKDVVQEVRSSIVDIKTAYYMYNQKTYEYWENTLYDINFIMQDLETKELAIYKEKGWL